MGKSCGSFSGTAESEKKKSYFVSRGGGRGRTRALLVSFAWGWRDPQGAIQSRQVLGEVQRWLAVPGGCGPREENTMPVRGTSVVSSAGDIMGLFIQSLSGDGTDRKEEGGKKPKQKSQQVN